MTNRVNLTITKGFNGDCVQFEVQSSFFQDTSVFLKF